MIGTSCFFFFQAEDGIRDYKVTGVQTCALPISRTALMHAAHQPGTAARARVPRAISRHRAAGLARSLLNPGRGHGGPQGQAQRRATARDKGVTPRAAIGRAAGGRLFCFPKRNGGSMKKSRLVMVGNGMAGVRTLEELLKIAPDLYEITVFGAEPHPNYNRIMLSPVLAGEQQLDEIILNDWSWYAQHGITLHAGCRVHAVDRARR